MMRQSAFTLVELSIVLVILGLLIGGVLTGQTLIRAAELRSVATQEARYIAAVQTFRDKYFALPGDMTNATAYWGIAAGSTGSDSTCYAAASTDAKTCNGNGDGKVGNASDEMFRFWQHMANAGLIEGSYNGIPITGCCGTSTANAPSGRISGSLWYAIDLGTRTSTTYAFDGQYDNTLQFGGYSAGNDPNVAVFKPEEAYNIDTKMDDGMPGTGKIVARVAGFSATNCAAATASTQTGAAYNLAGTALTCGLYFRQAF